MIGNAKGNRCEPDACNQKSVHVFLICQNQLTPYSDVCQLFSVFSYTTGGLEPLIQTAQESNLAQYPWIPCSQNIVYVKTEFRMYCYILYKGTFRHIRQFVLLFQSYYRVTPKNIFQIFKERFVFPYVSISIPILHICKHLKCKNPGILSRGHFDIRCVCLPSYVKMTLLTGAMRP